MSGFKKKFTFRAPLKSLGELTEIEVEPEDGWYCAGRRKKSPLKLEFRVDQVDPFEPDFDEDGCSMPMNLGNAYATGVELLSMATLNNKGDYEVQPATADMKQRFQNCVAEGSFKIVLDVEEWD